MKLHLKDVLLIALVSVISFPLLYFIMLLLTGTVKIVVSSNTPEQEKKQYELKLLKHSNLKDSLLAVQSQSFIASENAKKEVVQEREKLAKQEERIALLQQELDKTRMELVAAQEKFEKLTAQTGELEAKRIKQLAKVYGAMRAAEASQIMETLDDDLFIKILQAMGDDRQKAKIMSSISQGKASQISRKMGQTLQKK